MVARAISSSVGVIVLGVDAAIVDDEVEGVVHEAAIAALVVGRVAVHQLLLRQAYQLPRHDLVYALHCSNSRERPAAPCTTIQELAFDDGFADHEILLGRGERKEEGETHHSCLGS